MTMPSTPTETEVKLALERLCLSSEFMGSPVQRSLLEYVVGYSLVGEDRTGKDIAVVIFPGSDPDSSNVKANISFVRDKLRTYYSNDGKQEPVRIDLPIGRTYKASFSYQYKLEALQLYERGTALLGADSHASRLQTIKYFDLAIEADRTLSAAYLARLQVTICDVLLQQATAMDRLGPGFSYFGPLDGELEALEANPSSWFAWCLHGTSRLMGRKIEKARLAFEKALSFNPEQTSLNIGYIFYLLFTGRKEEALRLSELWDESCVDERLITARALFFYLAGEWRAAVKRLPAATASAREIISVNLLLQGLSYLERDRADASHWRIFLASQPWNPYELDYDTHYQSKSSLFEIQMLTNWGDEGFWKKYGLPELFSGFNILALVNVATSHASERAEAMELFTQIENEMSTSWFQLAIASMAVGRHEEAFRCLRGAIEVGDIFALHFDKWPFLSKLRDHPAFEELRVEVAARE